MATSFDEIYDLALVSFRDFRLDKLYSISELDFKNVLQGYLLKAIPKFNTSKKDLEDIDLVNKVFNNTLTLTEKVILSDYTVIEWMTTKILDVTQMQLHLNNTDFDHYAESQNLTAKVNVQNILIGRNDQEVLKYGLKNIPWAEWQGGNYDA